MKIIFFYWHFPKASKNVMNISFDISKKCYEDLAGLFFKRTALKYSARFTGKHLPVVESLFDKAALQHRCFPVNIVKFLRAAFLKNICEMVLLALRP